MRQRIALLQKAVFLSPMSHLDTFLIDTGSDVSSFPKFLLNGQHIPNDFTPCAANNTEIILSLKAHMVNKDNNWILSCGLTLISFLLLNLYINFYKEFFSLVEFIF